MTAGDMLMGFRRYTYYIIYILYIIMCSSIAQKKAGG